MSGTSGYYGEVYQLVKNIIIGIYRLLGGFSPVFLQRETVHGIQEQMAYTQGSLVLTSPC